MRKHGRNAKAWALRRGTRLECPVCSRKVGEIPSGRAPDDTVEVKCVGCGEVVAIGPGVRVVVESGNVGG